MDFFRKVTWLSVVLAIAVVVRHSVNIDVYHLEGGIIYWLQKYVSVITDLVVPLFFMISGYLFYRNFDYSCCLRKWKTRFFSLVIPYVIWNLVAYCYYEAIMMVPFVAGSMSKPVEPISLRSIFENAIWGLHNVTWFIRYLIVFVFVTPLFYFALKRKVLGVCLVSLLVMINGFVHNRYCMYVSIFLCGGVISMFWHDLVARRASRFVLLMSSAYLILTTIFELAGCMESIKVYVYPLLRISQGAAIWMAFDAFQPFPEPTWWAKMAFPIYVIHSMLLESIEKIFLLVMGRTLLGSVVDFVVAPILTLSIIFVFGRMMQKHAQPVWLVINGGRGV